MATPQHAPIGDNRADGAAAHPLGSACKFLDEDWERFRRRLEAVIEDQKDLLSEDEQRFYRAGKRVRPLMMLLFARIFADPDSPLAERVISAAASIEIAHIGSLIHDDIVDKAPLRRGLPTFNASRGYEFALLMGDLQIMESARVFASFMNAQTDLDLMRDYLDTAYQLCRGQIEELLNDEADWDLKQIARRYYRIIDRKTARLFSFSCEAGARLQEAYPSQIRHARRYGLFIGRAFQIADDVLDVVQSTREAGKQAFTDIALGRLSLPVIYAIHLSSSPDDLARILRAGSLEPDQVSQVADALFAQGAHIHAYNEGRVMVIEAKKHLDSLPDHPAKTHLTQIADYVVDRDFHAGG